MAAEPLLVPPVPALLGGEGGGDGAHTACDQNIIKQSKVTQQTQEPISRSRTQTHQNTTYQMNRA